MICRAPALCRTEKPQEGSSNQFRDGAKKEFPSLASAGRMLHRRRMLSDSAQNAASVPAYFAIVKPSCIIASMHACASTALIQDGWPAILSGNLNRPMWTRPRGYGQDCKILNSLNQGAVTEIASLTTQNSTRIQMIESYAAH